MLVDSLLMSLLQIVLSQEPPDADAKKNSLSKVNGFEFFTEPKYVATAKLISRRYAQAIIFRFVNSITLMFFLIAIIRRRKATS